MGPARIRGARDVSERCGVRQLTRVGGDKLGQRLRIPRRNRQDVLRPIDLGGAGGGKRRSFFNHDVRVGPAEAERADARAAHALSSTPRRLLRGHANRQLGPGIYGFGVLKWRCGGISSWSKRQDDFDQARDARGGLRGGRRWS